jgi:hypothetical protein
MIQGIRQPVNSTLGLAPFNLFEVTFPSDYDGFDEAAFNCEDVANDPTLTEVSNTGRPMIDGVEIDVNEMPYCDLCNRL